MIVALLTEKQKRSRKKYQKDIKDYHTYIHNWPLQPFTQNYWPSFSHHLCCVNFLYISGGTYNLKSTPNDRFFEILFMAILFTLRISVRNLLRAYCRRNTFRISFWCLAWDSNPGFSSNKSTHYLLDQGDFINHKTIKYGKKCKKKKPIQTSTKKYMCEQKKY